MGDFMRIVNYDDLDLTDVGQKNFERLNPNESRLECYRSKPAAGDRRRNDARGDRDQGRGPAARPAGGGGGSDKTAQTSQQKGQYKTPGFKIPDGVQWVSPQPAGMPISACMYHFKYKYRDQLHLGSKEANRDCRSETDPDQHGRCPHLHSSDFITMQTGATKASEFVDQTKPKGKEVAAIMKKDVSLRKV